MQDGRTERIQGLTDDEQAHGANRFRGQKSGRIPRASWDFHSEQEESHVAPFDPLTVWFAVRSA